MIYMDMLESYTVLHIKILHFFDNPVAFNGVNAANYYIGSPIHPLCDAFPELLGQDVIINKVVKDLYSNGLMNTENLNCTMSANGMVAKRTTQMGSDFIKFVTR